MIQRVIMTSWSIYIRDVVLKGLKRRFAGLKILLKKWQGGYK
jgi:hypothetical protein